MTKNKDIIDKEIELALNLLISSIKLHQDKHKQEIIDELVMTTHSIRDYFKTSNDN
jgi:predicted transcriptional regulator